MDKSKHSRDTLNKLYTFLMTKLPNFNYILFYGSLLGLIREGDFIENDDDIDVLLSIKDRAKLINRLQQLRLEITVNELSIIQFLIEGIGHIDVYFYEDRNTDILIKWDGNLLFSKNDIWPLRNTRFKNFFINIPYNSEKILEETYGANWRTPLDKSSYDWNLITTVRKL